MSRPHAATLAPVRAAILAWYDREHRAFPWRGTRDPYAVLVSEVMLQQTQAARVGVAFPRFLARFPSAKALAAASEAEVLAAWAGMGYNRRALALRRAAAIVAAKGWPSSVAALETLPGVGPYTARAVASLAFSEPVGVVDTNVRRWLVRRFGLSPAARTPDLQVLADGLATAGRDGRTDAWTHASMEFGAAVCATRRPRCGSCPIAAACPSRGAAEAVPVTRQPAFPGSDRQARGALVRALTEAAGHAITLARARRLVGPDRLPRLAAGLERDGLVHRSGRFLRLGGAARRGPATIDP